MSNEARWHDLGSLEELAKHRLRQITIGRTKIALTFKDGRFGAISGACNHAGGPLGEGHHDGDYVVCPWHHWKFHCRTGEGEPGFEQDRVPSYELREEEGRLWINLMPATRRHKLPHEPHPLARPVRREDGPVRVLGISTTVMDPAYPSLLHVRGAARDGARRGRGDGSRSPLPPALGPQVPRLRGVLLEERPRLHLAVLDHPDGPGGRDDRGL